MSEEEIAGKVRVPEPGDLFGYVIRRLGGSWLEVYCSDEKTRKVRIPGKLRHTRIFEGSIILVRPWYGLQEDERGDVVYVYRKTELRKLMQTKWREELLKVLPEELREELES